MGDVIDELKVQIDSSTKNADAKLDKFINRMLKLQSAITGLEMSNASGIASGINQISNAVQNFNTRNKTADFTRIASGLNRIATVDAVGVSNTARAMKTFADSMANAGMVNIDVTKLNEAVSVVTRLGGVNAGNAVNNLPQITKHLQQFVLGMNSAGALSFDFNGLNDLVNNISKLGGKKATQAVSNLKPIKEQILRFVSGLNGIGALNFDITGLSNLVSSITKLGGKGATNAIPNIQQLGTALSQLMSTLSKTPAVSQNLIQMTNALAALASNGNKVGTAANSVSRSLGFYSSSAKNSKKHSLSLASAIGKVYATYWMLFRALGLVRKSMDISSDLTEVQNVVDVTFGDMRESMEDFADTSLTTYGMSELMAKKIASRFQAMGIAMGLTQKKTSGMSIELTKLAADMASFYNVSQEEVAKSLQSIFTGETEPMRKYGLDLSQATLKEWALNNGLNANIQSMSIAQKTMLRYQYVMANSTQVMGDFARTSGSWHNQLVLLAGSFQTLGSIAGGTLINAFKPLLSALNAVMVKVIQFAEVVSNALGAIFGWKYETGGGFTDDFSGAADSADDLAGSTGEAAKNTKKMAENLQKFDKLNVISSQKDSGGSGGGAGTGGAEVGSGTGGRWVAAESLWEKYTSNIDSLYKLGDYIGDTLTQAMENINWDRVYQKAENFGIGLADFLNGLISPELFEATGKTIAGSLNTALHFLDSFGTTFEWTNFGKSIAAGINGFFNNFDFKLLGKTFNTWVKGILDAMITAIDGTRWDKIGVKIGTFLAEIDFAEIGAKVGILIWKAINAGLDIWSGMFSAAPIETTILTALAAVKISASTIAFLADLSTKISHLKNVLTTLFDALKAGATAAGPAGILIAVLSGIAMGLYRMNENWKREMADQFIDFQKEIGSNVNGVREASDSLHELSDETVKITSTAKEDAGKLGKLSEAYFELADKTRLTKDEQESLKNYAKDLIEQCPTLASAIDTVTGKYTAQKDEIEKVIKAQQEYKQAAAYEEVIGQYEAAQQKANVQLEMAQIEYSNNEEIIKRLTDAQEDLIYTTGDHNLWAERNKELLQELGVTYEEGNFQISDLSKKISFYTKENDELITSQKELEAELANSNRQLDIAREAYKNHSAAADEATKSSSIFQQGLKNLQTDLSGVSLNLSESFTEGLVMSGYDSSGLTSLFNSLKEGASVGSEELKGIFNDLGLTLPDDLAQALESKNADIQASSIRTLMSIGSGVQASETELKTLFSGLGITLPDSLIENLSSKETPVQSATTNLLSMLKNGYALSEGNLKTLFSNLGLNVPAELIASLDSKNADVQLATIGLLGNISTGYDGTAQDLVNKFSALGIDLPQSLKTALESEDENTKAQVVQLLGQVLTAEEEERAPLLKRLNDLGVDLSAIYDLGLGSNNEEIKKTSEAMVANTKEPIENEFSSTTSGSMYDAGANASKGFWQGIKDWWDDSWLGRKISEMKQTIAGPRGLDEHSPSKVTGRYGAFAGMGFNNEFQAEMKKTVPMTEEWISSIKAVLDDAQISYPGSDLSYTAGTDMLNSYMSQAEGMAETLPKTPKMNFAMETTAEMKNSNAELLHELRRNNELLEQLLDKPMLEDDDIFNASRRAQAQYYRRTKNPGYVF